MKSQRLSCMDGGDLLPYITTTLEFCAMSICQTNGVFVFSVPVAQAVRQASLLCLLRYPLQGCAQQV